MDFAYEFVRVAPKWGRRLDNPKIVFPVCPNCECELLNLDHCLNCNQPIMKTEKLYGYIRAINKGELRG